MSLKSVASKFGKMGRLSSILLLLLAFTLQAQPERVLETWKKDKSLQHATISWSVRDLSSQKIVSQYLPSSLLIPASTQKIFCTAAALTRLGPDFRFETPLCYTGTLDKENGILRGDLIIIGSGDPSLQSKYTGTTSVTDKWAAELLKLGIRKIEGGIIGDAGAFPRAIPSKWLYEDVSNYYGAGVCALNFFDNQFILSFNSGEPGTMAELIGTKPLYDNQPYFITHSVTASGKSDEAYVYGDPTSFTRSVFGSIPPNKKNYELEAALPDPALLCAERLQKSLLKLGITCKNKASSRYQTPGTEQRQTLYTHYSVSLKQLVQITNQYSNNLYCEALRYLLGKGDPEKGLAEIKAIAANYGVDTSALFLADAAGLSRLNACTTEAESLFLTNLLNKQSSGPSFLQTLPVAGRPGSLATLGKGTYLENNLTAKSGNMSRVRAYTGYLKTKSGKDLVFSVIINNFSCSGKAMKPKFETFLLSLSEL